MDGLAARHLVPGTGTSTGFCAPMLQSPQAFRLRSKVLLYSLRLSEATLLRGRG